MELETASRSFLKTTSYRLLGTAATVGAAFALTRRTGVALSLGGADLVLKLGLFYLHERAWNRIRFGRVEVAPLVVWFTGLSGAGKSTLAERVAAHLSRRGLRVESLDGDRMRAMLPTFGYSREQRNDHIRRVRMLASYLEKHGVCVVSAFISPYEESRQFARASCRNFVEIHLSTSLAECERRDVKGLYARARRGDLLAFTGVSDPYESPTAAELTLDTTRLNIDEAAATITEYLDRRLDSRREVPRPGRLAAIFRPANTAR